MLTKCYCWDSERLPILFHGRFSVLHQLSNSHGPLQSAIAPPIINIINVTAFVINHLLNFNTTIKGKNYNNIKTGIETNTIYKRPINIQT